MARNQPKATERLLTSFYDTGVADGTLYAYVPMEFDVAIGFPTLAKIMLSIVLLISIMVAAAIWCLIQSLV